MPTSFKGELEETQALIKFTGKPKEPDRPEETTRWRKFLKFIWPWANKGGQLVNRVKEITEAYYSSEAVKKENEANKFAAEAENIAADTDLKKQEKVKVVNEEIQRIFSQDNVPDTAKKLQLANLLANNPQIGEQLEKIESIVQKMKVVNFSEFELELENNEDKRLDKPDTSNKH
ncbi:MAG: hypothetical protein AAGA80_28190 [Cyanobacteria bacterium P01_F01_bin.143]